MYPKHLSLHGADSSAENARQSPGSKAEYDNMKGLLKLKKENDELRKEVAFLKKAAASFAEEIDQRLIDL